MPGRHDGGWYGSSRQPESRLAEADCLHSASALFFLFPYTSSPRLSLSLAPSSFAFSTVSCRRPLTVTRLSPPLVPQHGPARRCVSRRRCSLFRWVSLSFFLSPPIVLFSSYLFYFSFYTYLSSLPIATLLIAYFSPSLFTTSSMRKCDIDSEPAHVTFCYEFPVSAMKSGEFTRYGSFYSRLPT